LSKRLIPPLLFALAIALIVVGCGGGGGNDSSAGSTDGTTSDGTTSDGTAALSKAAFIKQADAACASGKKEVEAEFAAYLKKNNIKEIGASGEPKAEAEERKAEVVNTIGVPAYQQQVDAIGALAAPAGDEATIEEFIAAAEEGIETTEEEPEAVFDGTSNAFAKADKVGQKFGFKVCGNN
jgi:hypothetical protein